MALILSPKWLSSIVGEQFDIKSVADKISQLGLETECLPASTQKLTNVVTGRVVATEQHPDADRLKVCQVDVNDSEVLTIVCGCPTVAPDMVVAVAMDGATLPEMTIKASKLRGVASQGMLCTALELGMSSQKSSLLSLPQDTPLGQPISDVLGLDQAWMEVEITPNRGDCVSAYGVAREIGIGLSNPIHNDLQILPCNDNQLLGKVDANCLSYAYAQIDIETNEHAKVSDHMDYQLHVSGFNRVSPIVDILNYVMLYLGQPMHAFDFDKVNGQVRVRFANDNETIQLLDGQEITLETTDLVIADDTGPIALAGIMGGENSKVTDATKSLLLESACFDPVVIAKTAKRLGLNTDASYRYVRGTDPALVNQALAVATQLIAETYNTYVVRSGLISNEKDKEPIRIGLKDVADYLGLDITIEQLKAFMGSIGCQIIIEEADYITVKVPSYRNDLCYYYDLIEEVARLIGYEQLPKAELTCKPLNVEDKQLTRHHQLVEALVSRGYQELYSLSLQSMAYAKHFADEASLIHLDNPLSEEYAVMRPSVLSSLVLQIKQCLNHFLKQGKLVEVGNCFAKPMIEMNKVGLAAFGEVDYPEVGTNTFSRIKQDLCAFVHRLKPGVEIKFLPPSDTVSVPMGWHPNQTAVVVMNDQSVGFVGRLHPQLQQDIAVEVHACEIDLAALDQIEVGFVKPHTQSKFPPSSRDLSFWVKTTDCAGILKSQITAQSDLLTKVDVVDDYFSTQDNQRSLTFRLTFQSFNKTLKVKEIDKIIENTVAILAKDGIKIRDH